MIWKRLRRSVSIDKFFFDLGSILGAKLFLHISLSVRFYVLYQKFISHLGALVFNRLVSA